MSIIATDPPTYNFSGINYNPNFYKSTSTSTPSVTTNYPNTLHISNDETISGVKTFASGTTTTFNALTFNKPINVVVPISNADPKYLGYTASYSSNGVTIDPVLGVPAGSIITFTLPMGLWEITYTQKLTCSSGSGTVSFNRFGISQYVSFFTFAGIAGFNNCYPSLPYSTGTVTQYSETKTYELTATSPTLYFANDVQFSGGTYSIDMSVEAVRVG